MNDIFDIEEDDTEKKYSKECFCQLCRPVLVQDQEEVVIVLHELVAA